MEDGSEAIRCEFPYNYALSSSSLAHMVYSYVYTTTVSFFFLHMSECKLNVNNNFEKYMKHVH